MRTVAALYVDARGVYPKMPGVDCWDEARDARTYEGPWPVVAHPPCGPWGKLVHLYKGNERDLGPLAVDQVRRFGGVLEHPADSRLWRECRLPLPSEFKDQFGGFTERVDQVKWGHKCRKPTWLYCVGIHALEFCAPAPFPNAEPTHGIWYGDFERSGHAGPHLLVASKEIRRRTPPLFAQFLVDLARSSQITRPA